MASIFHCAALHIVGSERLRIIRKRLKFAIEREPCSPCKSLNLLIDKPASREEIESAGSVATGIVPTRPVGSRMPSLNLQSPPCRARWRRAGPKLAVDPSQSNGACRLLDKLGGRLQQLFAWLVSQANYQI